MTCTRPYRRTFERGAALIVGLVLLLALTILGIAGIGMSALEARMAGNAQAAALAFQAAETGIEVALSGPVSTTSPVVYTPTSLGDGSYEFEGTIRCVAVTSVPRGAYSETVGARAIHFEAEFTGHGPRGAESSHTQGIYIVGAGPENPNFDPDVSRERC